MNTNKSSRRTNKYMLLTLILIAVFILSGCRTRLTNNSEVSNVQYDEGGYLSETYQMRRDELGLTTAERPILPDFGSPEEDDSDDFSEGESIDYDPDDYQEDFTEPDTNTNTNTNTNTSTRSNRTNPSTGPRTTPGRSTTTTTTYTITFNANEGKCGEKSRKVKKGNSIGSLPKPTRSGYTFEGWYTSKTGGSKVDSKTVVNSGYTLYAHWKKEEKKEDPKPDPTPAEETITITFDANGGENVDNASVVKGNTYKLPTTTRDGYTFDGWKDESGTIYEGGTEINAGADLKLTAEWTPTPRTHWESEFKEAVEKTKDDSKPNCLRIGKEDTKFIQDCNVTFKEEDDYDYVIQFAKSKDVSKTLTALAGETDADGNLKYEGKTIIVMSEDATKDKNKLAYQIALMNIIHNSGLEEEQAKADLLDGDIVIDSMEL